MNSALNKDSMTLSRTNSITETTIPTVQRCCELMEEYGMLDNIRAHSFMVAYVADVLVEGLEQKGCTLDRDEVIAAALLHDIAKTKCLGTEISHAREGRKICDALGYPELGEMVEEHVILKVFRSDLYTDGIFSARELVYYADKRVRHDEIVNLDSRLAYIIERYGHGNPERIDLIRSNFAQTVAFEKYLFDWLDFSPEDIGDLAQRSSLRLRLQQEPMGQ